MIPVLYSPNTTGFSSFGLGVLTEFDESTWLAVIDTVLVKPDGKLVFRFANGMEVER